MPICDYPLAPALSAMDNGLSYAQRCVDGEIMRGGESGRRYFLVSSAAFRSVSMASATCSSRSGNRNPYTSSVRLAEA